MLAYAASRGAGGLTFPSDLLNYEFYMTLDFYAYSMPGFTTGNASRGNSTKLGSINLPMPNYMVDNQLCNFDQEALSTTLGAGLSGLNGGDGAGNKIADAIKGVMAAAPAQYTKIIADRFAAWSRQSANAPDALLQALGMTINPFMTVMFKSPVYKKHSLSWKLSPKNENESSTLNSIINFIRFNQLPDSTAAGALLTYPNIVKISVSNAPSQYFSYVFKPAVIETSGVNYAPAGQPSFFNQTKAPGEVELSLSILEIEFWLRPDYK